MPSLVMLAWGDRGDSNPLVSGFTGQRLGLFGFGHHDQSQDGTREFGTGTRPACRYISIPLPSWVRGQCRDRTCARRWVWASRSPAELIALGLTARPSSRLGRAGTAPSTGFEPATHCSVGSSSIR